MLDDKPSLLLALDDLEGLIPDEAPLVVLELGGVRLGVRSIDLTDDLEPVGTRYIGVVRVLHQRAGLRPAGPVT